MKAIVYSRFGSPDVLELREVPQPTPQDAELRIKIVATAVATEDPGLRAAPGLNGFRKPRRSILGFYFAGVVEATGKDVRQFQVGDAVYGNSRLSRLGTYAEYLCLPEDGALVHKPARLTFAEATAVPNGFLTALPFLRDKGRIQRGQRVLINGASGAVGTAAVQLARHFGADVTGVCSTANLELVRGLGAHAVIDYTTTDFAAGDQRYDIIFDAVGKRTFADCQRALNDGGVYLTTVPTPAVAWQSLWTAVVGRKKVRFATTGLRPAAAKRRDLLFLNELLEAGAIRPVVDRCYPLVEMATAHRYVESRRKRGNVVITVAPGLTAPR